MSRRRLKKLLQKNTDILKDIALVYFCNYTVINDNLGFKGSYKRIDANPINGHDNIWIFLKIKDNIYINYVMLRNDSPIMMSLSNKQKEKYYKLMIKIYNNILKDPWGTNGKNRKKIKVTKK